jgi:hypothetical protein
MKICLSLVHLITVSFLLFEIASAQVDMPQARIVSLNVGPEQVLVLHLHPDYVSSVRVVEEVTSVVLGDPGAFKAEHSEAEPHLVFFKATSTKPAQTNALITTKGGREIALSLVSGGRSDNRDPVDYLLTCERPHSFLIAATIPTLVIGETRSTATTEPASSVPQENPVDQDSELLKSARVANPQWQGKLLRVAAGQPMERDYDMAVPFAVLNSSQQTVELLPPQIQLAGISKNKHLKAIKAEPVGIKSYWISMRKLAPGARADGIVVFERPSFKESRETLLLSVAQAEQVDRPVLAPIAFVSPLAGGTK